MAENGLPKGAMDADDDLENMVLSEMVEPHICRISLNRPHRRNAVLSPDMNELLARRLEDAQDDDRVKVIILAGEGPDFCSGEDTRCVAGRDVRPEEGAAPAPVATHARHAQDL